MGEPECKPAMNWARLLAFSSGDCDADDDDDDEEEDDSCQATCSTPIEPCEEDEEEKSPKPKPPGGFSRRLGCMSRGAKNGLKDGALTGVFLGGAYGMYKYFYKGEKEGGEDSEDSTLNDNIIFVMAANGAIAMAVFCTFFCSTKAMIYCS